MQKITERLFFLWLRTPLFNTNLHCTICYHGTIYNLILLLSLYIQQYNASVSHNMWGDELLVQICGRFSTVWVSLDSCRATPLNHILQPGSRGPGGTANIARAPMLLCDWPEKSPHCTSDAWMILDGDSRRHSPDTSNTFKLFRIPLRSLF